MDDFLEKYTHFIDAYLELSTQELHTKKTLLLREGMICHKLYFIKKGILRFFYYNEAGEDLKPRNSIQKVIPFDPVFLRSKSGGISKRMKESFMAWIQNKGLI